MRRFALALMFLSLSLGGALADQSCQAQADAKKLAGAALNSFMKKCESDAQDRLWQAGRGQKALKALRRTSFTKKCVKDATGA